MPSRKQYSTNIIPQTQLELHKFLESSFTESLKQLIRVTVKTMIKSEMDEFRQEMKELMGTIYFNGSYERQLMSPLGRVEQIPVPRFRSNPQGFVPQTLSVFDQQQDQFMQVIAQMHRLGVSQRKIKQLAKICFNTNLSTGKVGAVYKELADQEAAKINTKPLMDEYQYLFADGLWVKTKGYGWDSNRAVILCLLGITPSGERTIIGFDVCADESSQSWHQLLLKVKQRGLLGQHLQLIISDDGTGFHSAIKQLFPKVPHQVCIVHKMRNVIGRTKHKNKQALAQDVRAIYEQPTKEAAILKAKQFVKQWYLIEPTAIDSLKHHFDQTLTYYQFDQKQWHRIRTTNILEREFREIRRRIKVMDSSFNDTNSAYRYAGSIINYLNQNYPSHREGLHTNGWHYPSQRTKRDATQMLYQ